MARLAGRLDPNLLGLIALCVVVLPLAPLLNRFQNGVAAQVLLFAALGVAWNLMSGFGGAFSFGHAAFFGIGAYAAAAIEAQFRGSPWLGLALGALVAALLGVALGYLSFRYRLKGVYFALATFAVAEMLRLLVSGFEALNGPRGLTVPLIGSGSSWALLQFPQGAPEYVYLGLGLLVLAQLVVILLLRSRWGLLLLATREDEEGAAAAGVDTLRYRLLAISLSAALAAAGGVYYAQYYFFINPDVAFGASVSISVLLPAVVGGMRTIWGPVVGSLLVTLLGQLAAAAARTPPEPLEFLRGVSGLDRILYGLALMVMIVFIPRGLVPTAAHALRGRQRRPPRADGEYAAARS
jgi:branched-chain amino acid transport system permease protein